MQSETQQQQQGPSAPPPTYGPPAPATGGSATQMKVGLRGLDFAAQERALTPPPGPVQKRDAPGGGDGGKAEPGKPAKPKAEVSTGGGNYQKFDNTAPGQQKGGPTGDRGTATPGANGADSDKGRTSDPGGGQTKDPGRANQESQPREKGGERPKGPDKSRTKTSTQGGFGFNLKLNDVNANAELFYTLEHKLTVALGGPLFMELQLAGKGATTLTRVHNTGVCTGALGGSVTASMSLNCGIPSVASVYGKAEAQLKLDACTLTYDPNSEKWSVQMPLASIKAAFKLGMKFDLLEAMKYEDPTYQAWMKRLGGEFWSPKTPTSAEYVLAESEILKVGFVDGKWKWALGPGGKAIADKVTQAAQFTTSIFTKGADLTAKHREMTGESLYHPGKI